jgi:hypothetical protein
LLLGVLSAFLGKIRTTGKPLKADEDRLLGGCNYQLLLIHLKTSPYISLIGLRAKFPEFD